MHAESFIERTLGEFIYEVCLIEFTGFLCGNPTEILNYQVYYLSSRQTVCKSNPGTLIVCRKWGASRQVKIQNINIDTVNCKNLVISDTVERLENPMNPAKPFQFSRTLGGGPGKYSSPPL